MDQRESLKGTADNFLSGVHWAMHVRVAIAIHLLKRSIYLFAWDKNPDYIIADVQKYPNIAFTVYSHRVLVPGKEICSVCLMVGITTFST